ncbi:MAG TPA: biotin/lipoyl-containing protein, partial [Acidobacteriaceae bacterium]|nr:biotin/lipoyl-containing protein [Acidobacteriaceae bacterium]
MPTNVVMPQMGESIFEGTITKWLKKAGETVQRDEPLFEISTDKVDAEIPSPASGVLSEIKIAEGATVEINTVVAVIAENGNAAAANSATTVDAKKEAKQEAVATAPEKANEPVPAPAATKSASPPVPPAATASAPASAESTGGTDVVMPQMGESIFEGTITKWLKKVGDTVARDEPLFEISTDKVDAEIPSPAAGVLTDIKVPEGSTVEINTIVAVIGGTAGATALAAAPAAAEKKAAPTPQPAAAPVPVPAAPPRAATTGEPQRSSPLVRRIAKENNLDLSQIPGTGAGGRITKDDALAYIGQRGNASAGVAAAPQAGAAVASTIAAAAPQEVSIPGDLVPLSKMRAIIAQRMVESKHTSAHVHSVFKIDMTRIVRIREREKSKYEQRNGVKLTYMPFVTSAVVS